MRCDFFPESRLEFPELFSSTSRTRLRLLPIASRAARRVEAFSIRRLVRCDFAGSIKKARPTVFFPFLCGPSQLTSYFLLLDHRTMCVSTHYRNSRTFLLISAFW